MRVRCAVCGVRCAVCGVKPGSEGARATRVDAHAWVHMHGCTCMGAHAWVHMHGCTCMGAGLFTFDERGWRIGDCLVGVVIPLPQHKRLVALDAMRS